MQEQDRDVSPDNGHGPDRKRRRKILSCTDCRRRKVQCDRSLPACSRCVKADKAASCIYEDETPTDSNSLGNQPLFASSVSKQINGQASVSVSREVWDDMLSRLLHQERTIQRLHDERTNLMRSNRSKYISEPGRDAFEAIDNDGKGSQPESMMFRGKAFKTQFHGPTDARSALMHVCSFILISEGTWRC